MEFSYRSFRLKIEIINIINFVILTWIWNVIPRVNDECIKQTLINRHALHETAEKTILRNILNAQHGG